MKTAALFRETGYIGSKISRIAEGLKVPPSGIIEEYDDKIGRFYIFGLSGTGQSKDQRRERDGF